MVVLSMSAKHSIELNDHKMVFDYDSYPIGIDDRCSGCMSHLRKDFIGPLRKVNITVRGFAGVTVKEVYTSTIKWKIPDDTGAITEFVIPNSYYVPSGGVRLLSPQHLAQVCKDNYPKPKGTQLVTYDDHCVLYWNQLRQSLTIPVDPKTNLFTLTSTQV
jgi:hypothetical protein